jgi:hypothetical protein
MTYLATQTVTLASVEPTFNEASEVGNEINAGDRTYIHVRNGAGGSINSGSITVVIDDPNSVAPEGATEFDPDVTIVLAPNSEKVVGPLQSSRFTNRDDGLVHISYDITTSLEIAVLQISSVAP